MTKKRQEVRHHISAAKDWLNQAEDSINLENDVRGDLNLMLAQAELKRAQETKPQSLWLTWLKRLAPVTLAVCIAAGVLYWWQDAQNDTNEVNVPVVVESQTAAEESAIPEKPAEQASINNQQESLPQEQEVQPGSAVTSEAGQTEAARYAADNGQHQAAENPHLPPPEMQKLMQVAGKALRE